jgi:hypothetical protein
MATTSAHSCADESQCATELRTRAEEVNNNNNNSINRHGEGCSRRPIVSVTCEQAMSVAARRREERRAALGSGGCVRRIARPRLPARGRRVARTHLCRDMAVNISSRYRSAASEPHVSCPLSISSRRT